MLDVAGADIRMLAGAREVNKQEEEEEEGGGSEPGTGLSRSTTMLTSLRSCQGAPRQSPTSALARK